MEGHGFTNADGTPFIYQDWATGQPGANYCAVFTTSSAQLATKPCNEQFAWICKGELTYEVGQPAIAIDIADIVIAGSTEP